jgi:hypothetical protein
MHMQFVVPSRLVRKGRAAPSRHRRKCAICAHPLRAAIEDAFCRFESPARIAKRFRLANRQTVYRHATACGLFIRRNNQLGSSLGFFLEKSDRLIPTFTNVLHAVEKMAKIDVDGQTIRRPKTPPMPWEARG